MGALRALALVCTLKPSPEQSSSEVIARQILEELGQVEVAGELMRVMDHDIRPGVESDMGSGDEWPLVRRRLLRRTSLCSRRPPGWGTCPAWPNGRWKGSTRNSLRPMTRGGRACRQGCHGQRRG
jgi:hypothetical protein